MSKFLSLALLSLFLFPCALSSTEQPPTPDSSKNRICHLVQTGQAGLAIDLYKEYAKTKGRHDFETLSALAMTLLDTGARSGDKESQLLSIFGSGVANISASLDLLEAGIKSSTGEAQMASIQFLARVQDDRSDELLIKAMSSSFLPVRLEAAYQLSLRKHRASVGQIESLMYRFPPPLRFLFPQFFGLIGTADAIAILRKLMEDPYVNVRVEAILSAARFERDDLLPSLRTMLTHLNVAEQEAAAYAAGQLRDSKSLKKLKRLLKSSEDSVQIAAAAALLKLGDRQATELLLEKAKELNFFAIGALKGVKEAADLLAALCGHPSLPVRCNAAIALLHLRDPRCIGTLQEILILDTRDLGFHPVLSLGRSLLAWKVVASTQEHQKKGIDLQAVSLALREELLKLTIELPEREFLHLAETIFKSRQTDLVPLLVQLLANRGSDPCLNMLKQKARELGAPLIRGYANLELYRLQLEGPYSQYLKNWILRGQGEEMIRFKPSVSIELSLEQGFPKSDFELTPEDHSRLFISASEALADRHDSEAIDLLLELIHSGNAKNRYVLAGLLLRALQ